MFEQFRYSLSGLGRYADHRRFSSSVFRSQSRSSEILLDLIEFLSWLIYLGYRDDDRHARFFGVADGFDGLRHHAIVSSDDDDRYVRQFRSSRSQAREQFMSRSIDEAYLFAVVIHDGSSDGLGDTSRFSVSDGRLPEVIEQ